MIIYIVITSLFLGILLTFGVRAFSKSVGLVDLPDGALKKHARPVALLGGVALYLAFWSVIGYLVFFKPIFGIELIANSLGALFYGSTLLLLLGIVDETKPLSPRLRFGFIVLVLAGVASFIPLGAITNPFGGKLVLPSVAGFGLVFVWLLLTVMSTKLLDGVDGLATSVVSAGALIILLLTLSQKYYQPNVGLVAGVFLAVLAGFLIFNLPRASIFLGESGSVFIGFMIGGLSVLAGSKIVTALLVMAVPMLDVARVLYVRFKNKKPLMMGDRNHLHFVLIDRGWGEWQVLLLVVSVSTLFGLAGLYLQSYQKIVALSLLFIGFVIFSRRVTLRK